MKMDDLAGSGNDEFYTPRYAVKALLPFLPDWGNVWCPFDMPDSSYVQELTEAGFDVFPSHIETGQDFFKTPTPDNTHAIISNPPYSKKTEVIRELIERDLPFAMLVSISGLFDSIERAKMFDGAGIQILFLNPRVQFLERGTDVVNNPPFQSGYICRNLLPRDICFARFKRPKKEHALKEYAI